MSGVTRILNAIERGNAQATDELLPLVYGERRLLAAQELSQAKPGQTLQVTAPVHEAYTELVGSEPQSWENRGHFFAAASEAMRRILTDNVCHKQRRRHGGGHRRVDLQDVEVPADRPPEDLIKIDDGLANLS